MTQVTHRSQRRQRCGRGTRGSKATPLCGSDSSRARICSSLSESLFRERLGGGPEVCKGRERLRIFEENCTEKMADPDPEMAALLKEQGGCDAGEVV